jgi:hypothetical protein
MARCDWAIICDYAFLDENRKMCMVGIFDRIFATAVPAVHHQASCVLKLIGEPKERVHIRVDIVRPNGDVLGKIEGSGELSDDGTSQLNLGMRGLPLPDFGIYAFNIYMNDQFEKTIAITVTRAPEKTPSGGEGTRR